MRVCCVVGDRFPLSTENRFPTTNTNMHARTNLLTALAPLTLAASIAAQAPIVYPPAFAEREGQGAEAGFPFGIGVGRAQMHFQGALLPLAANAQIRGIGFRQDADTATADASHRVLLEVFVGTTAKTGAQFGSNYANNYAATPQVAFARRMFDLAARPASSIAPSPNTTIVPFDTPITFDPTTNLIVDFVVHANSNLNAAFRYSADVALFDTTSTTYGVGCQSSRQTLPRLAANEVALGGSWRASLTQAPASTAAALSVGLGNTTWQGLPLPFDMAPIGAPGCTLLVDTTVMFTGFVGTSGSLTFSLTTPDNVALDGVTLFGQAAILDPFANTLGIVTSNGVRTRFGRNTPIQVLKHVGDPARTTGSVTRNYGIVTLFDV
jgi:hypothetical protein